MLVWLNEEQAAEALGVTAKTLANWRSTGRGPAFYKLGRIQYRLDEVDDYKLSRRIDPETGEVGPPSRISTAPRHRPFNLGGGND